MGANCSRPAPGVVVTSEQQGNKTPAVVRQNNPIAPVEPQPPPTSPAVVKAGAADQTKKSFAMTYELKEKLGKGQYAVVHRALHRVTEAEVAVKCIKKATLTAEDLAAIDIEVKAMERLGSHPNFVKMYEMFAEKDYFFIVLELISGGELFDRICEKEKYSEREAREIIRQLAAAIAYMHNRGVVHRDLKPENILLKSRADDTNIKLADLGFAKLITSLEMTMTTPCGTPGYVAPEILSGRPYTAAADIWSMGVIFYILLCGYPPFVSEKDDQKELFALIREGRYTFDPGEWGAITDGAKDLIRHILVTDPKKRFTAEQILAHPWTRADASAIPDAPLTSNIAALKRFNARRRLKRTLRAVRTTVRMKLLLAARMQRVLDATREANGQAPEVPSADDALGTANQVLAALQEAEKRGMSVRGMAGGKPAPDDDPDYIKAATTSTNELVGGSLILALPSNSGSSASTGPAPRGSSAGTVAAGRNNPLNAALGVGSGAAGSPALGVRSAALSPAVGAAPSSPSSSSGSAAAARGGTGRAGGAAAQSSVAATAGVPRPTSRGGPGPPR